MSRLSDGVLDIQRIERNQTSAAGAAGMGDNELFEQLSHRRFNVLLNLSEEIVASFLSV